jgi:hypothetical protein
MDHKLATVDGEVIDLATGEVLPADPLTGDVLDAERVTLEELPKVGRWIAAVDRKLAHLKEPDPHCSCEWCNLSREIARLKAIAENKAEQLEVQRARMLTGAANLVTAIGQRSLKYPGIGRFGYRVMPERVDTSTWDKLDQGSRDEVVANHRDLFRVKVEPDRTAIKDVLRQQPDLALPFSLERGEDKFEFKAEG